MYLQAYRKNYKQTLTNAESKAEETIKLEPKENLLTNKLKQIDTI